MKETTVETLTKHASRFGCEGVMDAAMDVNLYFSDLVQLQKNLDEIEASRTRFHKPPRLSAETRVKRLLGIEDEEEGAS